MVIAKLKQHVERLSKISVEVFGTLARIGDREDVIFETATVRIREHYPEQFMPATDHPGVLLTPLEIAIRLASGGERRTLHELCTAIVVTRRAMADARRRQPGGQQQ